MVADATILLAIVVETVATDGDRNILTIFLSYVSSLWLMMLLQLFIMELFIKTTEHSVPCTYQVSDWHHKRFITSMFCGESSSSRCDGDVITITTGCRTIDPSYARLAACRMSHQSKQCFASLWHYILYSTDRWLGLPRRTVASYHFLISS